MTKKQRTLLFTAIIALFSILLTPKPKIQQQPITGTTPTNIASSSGRMTASVLRVVDGDTIRLTSGETVRYIGINTPETVAPNKPVECFGKEASQRNTDLVEGKVVELEKDITDRDRFGRLLRYVWVNGILVNELLVRDGFAQSSTFPPDVKYQDRFVMAQNLARSERKGLWGETCQK